MKNSSCGERQRKDNSRVLRSPFFLLVISISLVFASACQTQTQKPDSKTAAAKSETASNWPPKVIQIDEQGLKDLLKPSGKPRLINFWATWCGPCREEFPDLVKIGSDHKDTVHLITVSLDEVSEINGDVTEFLTRMKSDSPAYLLKTSDQDAAIELVSRDWQGALPFTILFNAEGETVYSKQGKFDTAMLVDEIEKF